MTCPKSYTPLLGELFAVPGAASDMSRNSYNSPLTRYFAAYVIEAVRSVHGGASA
jgi:hypothetical protein